MKKQNKNKKHNSSDFFYQYPYLLGGNLQPTSAQTPERYANYDIASFNILHLVYWRTI